jgi:hypothetical protein
MRVVPAPGMVLRDPRTKRWIDPELGTEVPATDTTFAWLLSHGDVVPLSDAAYQAALAKRDADQKAAAAATAQPTAAAPMPAAPAPAKPEAAPAPAAAPKGADA